MSIQQNINTSIGTVAGALAMNKHLKQQEVQLKADNAADLEQIKNLNTAIANDENQALIAIKAHRQNTLDEYRTNNNLTEDSEEYKKFVTDFDKKLENKDLTGLREILKQNRDKTVEIAGEDYAAAMQNRVEVENDPTASQLEKNLAYQAEDEYRNHLQRSYKRQEEVNERIAVTNKLRYDHDAAVARVKARGITKEIE